MGQDGVTTLITGASGFLGSTLAASAPGRVLAVGRDPQRCAAMSDRLGIPVQVLDLAGPDAAAALIRMATAAGVNSIVHAAALSVPWGKPVAYHRANVMGTQTVLRVADALGISRVVHISTSAVSFRFADQEEVAETAPLPPAVNPYAASKRAAEEMALLAGCVVLRPCGLYGAGDQAFMPRLLRAMRDGPLPHLRDGRAAADLTHVDDVVASIWAALAVSKGQGRVFNISGGAALPIREVVDANAQHCGIRARWRRLPLALVMAAARGMELSAAFTGREPRFTRYGVGFFAYRQTLDLSQAKAVLGWQPKISFDEGLARTFKVGNPWQ